MQLGWSGRWAHPARFPQSSLIGTRSMMMAKMKSGTMFETNCELILSPCSHRCFAVCTYLTTNCRPGVWRQGTCRWGSQVWVGSRQSQLLQWVHALQHKLQYIQCMHTLHCMHCMHFMQAQHRLVCNISVGQSSESPLWLEFSCEVLSW